MDERIFFLINRLPHDLPYIWGAMGLRYGAFLVLVIFILRHIGSRRRFVKGSGIILLPWLTANLLKFVINRPRPAEALQVEYLQHVYWSPAFPSAETALAFSLATLFFFLERRWSRRIVAFLLAAAIGVTRLYFGAHYPSDVLGGALLGVIGVAVWRINRHKII